MIRKVLVFRLSSFGDVVLASAFLEELAPDVQVTWVIKEPFVDVIASHPRVTRVVAVPSRLSLVKWLSVLRSLKTEEFEFIADLHNSLRTRIALLLSAIWLKSRCRIGRLKKERLRSIAFFVLKGRCPDSWRPRPMRVRLSEVALRLGLTRGGRRVSATPRLPQWTRVQDPSARRTKIAIMPSSRWPGKEWSVNSWVDLCQRLKTPIVVIGTIQDQASIAVLARLNQLGIPVESRLSKTPSLETAADALHESKVLVSVDTGLAHFAEAIGIPVVVLFGPTHQSTGFGPRLKSSQSVGADLWCRPCSKDGTACFRLGDTRFLCMQQITPIQVLRAIEDVGP
jgi:ADP-heptose:LPS heptosyltransferase